MKLPMIAGMATLALLAGCGSKEPEAVEMPLEKLETGDKVIVSKSTAGGSSRIAVSEDGTIKATADKSGTLRKPSEFQPFAPAYPGARIKTRVASENSEEGSGSMIAMHTPDEFAKVKSFYDEKAKLAGLTPKVLVDDDSSSIRIIGNEKSGAGALIAITRNTEKPGTIIVITSGSDKGARRDGQANPAEAAKVAASNGSRLQ